MSEGFCPEHGCHLEQTSYGLVCPACVRQAFIEAQRKEETPPERKGRLGSPITKTIGLNKKAIRVELSTNNYKFAGAEEKLGTGEYAICAVCGEEIKPPAKIVNGIGPCCMAETQKTAEQIGALPPIQMPPNAINVHISTLRLTPNAVEDYSPENIEKLCKALKDAGQKIPVIVNRENGEIIRGTGTILAMLHLIESGEMQFERVWIISSDLSEADKISDSLAEFVPTQIIHSEFEAVTIQIADILSINFDTTIDGYDPDEFYQLTQKINSHLIDIVPEANEFNHPASGYFPGTMLGRKHSADAELERRLGLPPEIHEPPKPIKTKAKVIIHVDEEGAADIIQEAMCAMRKQHDQVDVTDGELLILICKEWYKGKGRELPLQRPEAMF